MNLISPTPYPDVNNILNFVSSNVKQILGRQFIGMYLFGSLANGGFDDYSDIDILIVTDGEVAESTFSALKELHRRVNELDSPWALQVEASYIPQTALRRFDPLNKLHPHMDRGSGEVLHRMAHESDWIVQRHILRERGVVLHGPDLKSMIDPISSDDLRRAVVDVLPFWAKPILENPSCISLQGYQSYCVLTLCRMIYTLKHGEILSKSAAAQWGLEHLDPRWKGLIERALVGRQHPGVESDSGDIQETLQMMRYTLEQIMPTSYADVNEILNTLLRHVKSILGDDFVGMYLHGSLANGGFDAHSDIDIFVLTRDEITEEIFLALRAMHMELAKLDSPWSVQLEVAYIPEDFLRRSDPSNLRYPHLDRGGGETLHWMDAESDWNLYRYIVRERGLVVTGPDPKTLIGPVFPNDLRSAVAAGIPKWFPPLLQDPSELNRRGLQSFYVLSICRMLYTLKHGEILSKPAAAQWGVDNLDPKWAPLIERALIGRQEPDAKSNASDIEETLDMMRYIVEQIKPTPYPHVNEILNTLLRHVKNILGDDFVGMYLYGSLSSGDFDPETSDIDFLVVTHDGLPEDKVAALESMHKQDWAISSERALELEGSYVPSDLIRRHDPDGAPCPTVNEGQFYMDKRGSDWIIQRHVVREMGVIVEGPDPKTLIDPVSPDEIRSAVRGILHEWWFPMLEDPSWLQVHGNKYHAFAVITMCRVLHALEHGTVVSKPKAVQWSGERLAQPWRSLIDRAVRASHQEIDDDFLAETLDFIRFVKAQMEPPETGSSRTAIDTKEQVK